MLRIFAVITLTGLAFLAPGYMLLELQIITERNHIKIFVITCIAFMP